MMANSPIFGGNLSAEERAIQALPPVLQRRMARLVLGGCQFALFKTPPTEWMATCPCPPMPAWHANTTASTLWVLLDKMVGLDEVFATADEEDGRLHFSWKDHPHA